MTNRLDTPHYDDASHKFTLAVIIVNYNVKYFVEQCLISLQKAMNGINGEVYVVDNASTDGSVEYLIPRFPDVHFIESSDNVGFARANNMAIRQSDSKYVLLINPDTFVAEDTLRQVLEFMEANPEAGGAGVKMHNTDGSLAMESRRGLPTPLTALYKMCGLCARFPKSKTFGRYYMGYLSWDKPEKIEVMSGAFAMLRRKALMKAGLLDEDFFMYGEDIDLSYRLIKSGYSNWYLPHPILHYKGESTHKSSFRYVHVFYQAMLIFFRKHYGHLSFFVTLPIKIAIYIRSLIALIQMLTDKARQSLGFVSSRRKTEHFLFVGSEDVLSQCRAIVRRKGLDASFITKDLDSLYSDIVKNNYKDGLTLVFDTQKFAYGEILAFMHSLSNMKIQLGTYNPSTKVIITHKQIYK
jgi:GT2 family glycosyltransferase